MIGIPVIVTLYFAGKFYTSLLSALCKFTMCGGVEGIIIGIFVASSFVYALVRLVEMYKSEGLPRVLHFMKMICLIPLVGGGLFGFFQKVYDENQEYMLTKPSKTYWKYEVSHQGAISGSSVFGFGEVSGGRHYYYTDAYKESDNGIEFEDETGRHVHIKGDYTVKEAEKNFRSEKVCR